MAKAAMEEIYAKGKIPILVGGTGFYIQAVTRDIDFTEAGQEDGYRQSLRDWQKKKAANISMKCWKRWIRRARRPFTPIM